MVMRKRWRPPQWQVPRKAVSTQRTHQVTWITVKSDRLWSLEQGLDYSQLALSEKASEWPSKFSGKVLNKQEIKGSKNQYILQVNKNKFLDAEGPGHMVGKRINEGTISGIPNNVRFGASLRSYECKITGRQYKSVFAKRNIHPGRRRATSVLWQEGELDLPRLNQLRHGSGGWRWVRRRWS